MTTDLPDPHAGLAERWGEPICGMCGAPRVHATPGCPVRNAVSNAIDETFEQSADAVAKEHAEALRLLAGIGPITAEKIAEGESAVRDGRFVTLDSLRESVIAETERRVHDGGPRITQ